MSEPQKQVVHVYDDIEEEDNKLPNWWLALLFGSMIFGFGYWFVYHTLKLIPTPTDEYAIDAAALKKQRLEANPTSDEALLALVKDAAAVAEGQKVYATTCASCHAQKGEGLVGPNLTDKFWIHGGNVQAIYKSASEGFPEKGMPAWGMTLGADRVRKVTAFIMTIKGTNVVGKEPQGNEETP